MKEYLLGIDIGTSACKIAIFHKSGRVMSMTTEDYPVYYPHPGWVEQNPEEWWTAVCHAVSQALTVSGISPDEIAGIGIDGQSWSAIALDRQGKVLTNTPIWMDTRAKNICDELNDKIGQDQIFNLSGNSLQPSYTTAKIIWYRENKPDIYGQIDKILQSNSYIAYRLTGVISHDLSQGYGLHCFDMHTGTWNWEMCDRLGIPAEFLPDLYPSHAIVGTVTAQAALETGLTPGTPVAAGGLDAACGTLGTGVLETGETQEQGGQAEGMSICTDRYVSDPRLILGFHVVPGRWLLQGGTVGGGGVMRWLEKEFGAYERLTGPAFHKSSLDLYNEEAASVVPGSDGVIFLPYMAGERSPIWDPDAKGVFYGLDFSKTKGHLIRSAMEGVAYSLKHNLDIAEKTGAKVEVLRSMGGSANSLLWTQIKSDITGKPIVVPASDTATTLGAAILAGVGTGVYQSFREAVDTTIAVRRKHEPDPSLRDIYNHNYQKYIQLYENLKDLMRES